MSTIGESHSPLGVIRDIGEAAVSILNFGDRPLLAPCVGVGVAEDSPLCIRFDKARRCNGVEFPP